MTDAAYSVTLTGSSLILAPIVAAMLAGPSAYAAGVMIADDAGIVDAKACQVETSMNARRDSIEYWVLPACNFTGNLELSIGGSRTHDDSGTRTTGVALQGKTLFKPLEPDGWGMGLAVGTVRHPQADAGGGDWYAYVPAGFSFRDERFVLHTNIGWLREQETRRDRLTWGLGSETHLAPRTWLIAETFGQNQGRPQYQFGFRHWLAPDRAQIAPPTATVSAAARKNTGFPLDCACSPHDFYLKEST